MGRPTHIGDPRYKNFHAQVGYSRLVAFETRRFTALLTMRPKIRNIQGETGTGSGGSSAERGCSRVSASSMPIVKAIASIDEPP